MDNRYLQLGIALDRDTAFLSSFRFIGGIALFCMLGLGAVVAWWMAHQAISRVTEVTKLAARIAGGRFDERVTVGGFGKEIESLGLEFNRMAGKIQSLIQEMSQVNNSIAHDLRSPITRIRIMVENHAIENAESANCINAMADIIENCDKLTNMIDTMLNIAESEAGVVTVENNKVDLQLIVREAVELFQPVAEENNIDLRCEIETAVELQSDYRRIQRVLANLIDNAVKYTDSKGEIIVGLSKENGWASISVQDNGFGIPDTEQHKIFDRFYRCDDSRSRQGSGLGLSLARAVGSCIRWGDNRRIRTRQRKHFYFDVTYYGKPFQLRFRFQNVRLNYHLINHS